MKAENQKSCRNKMLFIFNFSYAYDISAQPVRK